MPVYNYTISHFQIQCGEALVVEKNFENLFLSTSLKGYTVKMYNN